MSCVPESLAGVDGVRFGLQTHPQGDICKSPAPLSLARLLRSHASLVHSTESRTHDKNLTAELLSPTCHPSSSKITRGQTDAHPGRWVGPRQLGAPEDGTGEQIVGRTYGQKGEWGQTKLSQPLICVAPPEKRQKY